MHEQYSTLAKYYDRIYHWKDHRKEAAKIRKLTRSNKHSSGRNLLDIGCGTGRHTRHLGGGFNCVGADISEQMLEAATKNALGVELAMSGITNFKLGGNSTYCFVSSAASAI